MVFVRNLTKNTTQADLEMIFGKFGPIEKVLLLIQKSHAFVQFKNLEDAKRCLREESVDNEHKQPDQNLILHDKHLYVSSTNRSEI